VKNLNEDPFMSDINVTPLVDVMLVLLIIFMITAPMLTYGVRVDLPTVTTKPMKMRKEPIIITIDKKKNIFIDRYTVSLKKLKEKISSIIKSHPYQKILLQADKNVPYGYVMEIMAEIKAAGVEQVGLITQPKKKK